MDPAPLVGLATLYLSIHALSLILTLAMAPSD